MVLMRPIFELGFMSLYMTMDKTLTQNPVPGTLNMPLNTKAANSELDKGAIQRPLRTSKIELVFYHILLIILLFKDMTICQCFVELFLRLPFMITLFLAKCHV